MVLLSGVLALAMPGVGASVDAYLIVGDVPALVGDGEAVLSRSTTLGAREELARKPIAHGRFRIAGESHPGRVSLQLYDTDENYKGTVHFILEPGEIRIEYPGPIAGLMAQGGPLNRRVIAGWRDSEAYRSLLEDYHGVREARLDLKDDDERADPLREAAIRLYNELNRTRREALREVALSADDPVASLCAIEMGGLSGQEALDKLAQLETLIGQHPTLSALRQRLKTGVRMRETRRTVQVGTQVEVFEAKGLDQGTYALADALAENEYVLVEFWASWCGPCRADNPHLKEVYQKYKARGFEIFAFSLDHDLEDWAEASEEDGIPWINTSDLQAYDGPVPGLFGVLAIPMNLLLDGEGRIVAINVRSEALDEKLVELFGI